MRFLVTSAVLIAAGICFRPMPLHAQEKPAGRLAVSVLYIQQQPDRPPVLSNIVTWPEDEGLQGARLAIADNNTTGKFLNQDHMLAETLVEPGGDVVAAARAVLDGGPKLAVLNVPGDRLKEIAALPEAADDLLFNAGSADDDLRDAACMANVLHTLPSRAMLSDALMQFLAKRQWRSLFLIAGNRPGDLLFAEALRRSARKFGLSIDHEKQWIEDADMRRNASAEVPVFTQARNYDAVIVADEDHDFGQYVMYNTWLPRPVAGSAGIVATAWDRVVEQWGAAQLQSRFEAQAKRGMMAGDYAAWAAIRSIGEAATRARTAEPAAVRGFILSDQFSLAAFKGAKMTYRGWDGQLRQPIALIHPQAVVATAPVEGFLHRVTELDTLGLDEPESKCTAFKE
ncbi:MAG: ABC transporter substrate-binding protein [Brucellaceae bacterium]|nr:ABC transporter substrate-binding protein [Brucellaceae bacterium]